MLRTSTLRNSVVRTTGCRWPCPRRFFGCCAEPGRRGPPNPSAGSRRSAVWAPGSRRPRRGGGAAPGRTAIHRKPGGSRGGVRCHPGPRAVWPAGAALRAPPRVGRRRVRQWRHQRPAAAGTPLASPLAHVPPSAALGAHLDHRTSLAPATMRAALCGQLWGTTRLRGESGAIQHRSGDNAGRGMRRGQHQQLHMAIHSFHRFIHN